MRGQIGLLSIVGFFGLLATADAQTLSAGTAGPAFDGTYQAVSSAKVNSMYIEQKGNMIPCPDRMPGPLTVVQGEAQYTDASGDQVDGTVGPQGELAMGAEEPGGSRAMDLAVRGGIAANGTVRARQEGNSCSYDFVWQKIGQHTEYGRPLAQHRFLAGLPPGGMNGRGDVNWARAPQPPTYR